VQRFFSEQDPAIEDANALNGGRSRYYPKSKGTANTPWEVEVSRLASAPDVVVVVVSVVPTPDVPDVFVFATPDAERLSASVSASVGKVSCTIGCGSGWINSITGRPFTPSGGVV
jgi:hypothetical protein